MEDSLQETTDTSLQVLMDMGFSREESEEALVKNGYSVELAAAYLLNLSEEVAEEWEDVDEGYKMVFVVNSDLKMSIGKTAAQVAHGCLGLYREIELGSHQESRDDLVAWLDEGQKKIVLSGKNTDALVKLCTKAKDFGIPSHLVKDAGHTEVAAGSTTVLALFGSEETVNKVTGSLRLLK
ncbi:probable peptidyl-tRNA hydrolase 2 [Homalodisca vitripennis]|nr:probable peptidyl-tRNA hydrolase 2 [Homalodisca vitripennis]